MTSNPQGAADDAAPFAADGGRIGVVLCHGFTGSPASMNPWGRHLADHGFSVRVPLLPGHGTTWQEMNTTTWRDWYDAVDTALSELRERCDRVAVAGLSMGGALALRLAEQRGTDVAAVVLVNPAVHLENKALRFVKHVSRLVPSIAGIANDIKKPGVSEGGYDRTPLKALHSQTLLWADVRENLATVTQPVLLLLSTVDHVVDPSSAAIIRAGIGSKVVEEFVLDDSYHVATLDHDAPALFDRSTHFLENHVGLPR